MKTCQTHEFLFDYGTLPLALAATLRIRAPQDLLDPPGAAARWLHQAGLMATPAPVSEAHVQALKSLRRVIRMIAEAVLAGTALPPMEVASLNTQAAMPLAIPQLDAMGRTVMQIAPDPAAAAIAALARASVELFGGPDARRIKQCEMEDCRALFLDGSPGGQRRWCSNRCSARAKAKAFRARHKATKA